MTIPLTHPVVAQDPATIFREEVLPDLKALLGAAVFESWIARLQLDCVIGTTACLTAPTRFLVSWIREKYLDRILPVVAKRLPGITRAEVALRTAAARLPASPPASMAQIVAVVPAEPKPVPAAPRASGETAQPTPTVRVAPAFEGSPLDLRLTFETFFTGTSNQLAYSAARTVAGSSDQPVYNPLFVHGAVGLGKTHLIQAVAHAAAGQGRQVLYLTAEKFMYGLVVALRNLTALEFRKSIRDIDLLIVDDVQFLQGKSVQQEFCQTISAMLAAGKQIVVAGDRPPGELESLEERTRSRLAAGLCVAIGSLDSDLGHRILAGLAISARVRMPAFGVGDDVLAHVASLIRNNGRDLAGAMNRLMATWSATGEALTPATAEIAIQDLIRAHEPKRVRIEDIQRLVATHYNVSRSDIMSARRTANVVRPRQIAMYLAKVMTLRSLPEIGRRFGGRDHTTVLHAVRKIECLAGADRLLRDELKTIRAMLEDA